MADKPSNWFAQSRQYLAEVQGEFNKVTWPPQEETLNGSIAVVVIVLVIAAFLGIVDFGLSRLMQQVIG